jgi:hypothetical protein
MADDVTSRHNRSDVYLDFGGSHFEWCRSCEGSGSRFGIVFIIIRNFRRLYSVRDACFHKSDIIHLYDISFIEDETDRCDTTTHEMVSVLRWVVFRLRRSAW